MSEIPEFLSRDTPGERPHDKPEEWSDETPVASDQETGALLDMDFDCAQKKIHPGEDESTVVRTLISRTRDLKLPLRSVLVIDDLPLSRGSVCEGIARMHPNVITLGVLDPHVGLRLLEHQYFDVVVCDMRMPDIRGDVIIKKTRKLSPTTFSIAMTGEGMEYSFAAGKQDADGFFGKNKPLKELIQQVGWGLLEVLKRRKAIFTCYYNEATDEFSFTGASTYERDRMNEQHGIRPIDYRHYRKQLRAHALRLLKLGIPEEKLVEIAGYSSKQRLKKDLQNFDELTAM